MTKSEWKYMERNAMFFHVFYWTVPDEFYPDCEGEVVCKDGEFKCNGLIIKHRNDMCIHFSIDDPNRLKAWELIDRSEKMYYHGVFQKLNNFGRFWFKQVDPDVLRAFNNRKVANKFDI
jgi:hypothetical protein